MTDFFILAGGFGKRAEPLTVNLPKPLFPLNGIPLLSIIAGQMNSFGLKKGFINTHHLGSLISDLPLNGLDVSYIEEKQLSGNRILSECCFKTKSDLLVVNGDTFLDIPAGILITRLRSEDVDGIILVRKKDGLYSSIIKTGNIFLKRDKDPNASDLMYTGVSVFRNSFLKKLNRENLFDSLEHAGGKIAVIEYRGLWLDLGTPENYFLADREYRKANGFGTGNSLSAGSLVQDPAIVENSIVWPNSKISGNAVISNSIITADMEITSGSYTKKILTNTGIYDLGI